MGRFPITNDQWQEWVKSGAEQSRFADDSDVNHPNQPVVGITWYACNEFCAWLTQLLVAALPADYNVRLPNEQEWEAAARGGDARRYPWGDAWQDDRAAVAEDQETRGWRWTVPVGCYPAGAAPCGAHDMAGNVGESTASSWQSYPGAAEPLTDDDLRVLRGGRYDKNRTIGRCGARYCHLPSGYYDGFRIVVAPHLAH